MNLQHVRLDSGAEWTVHIPRQDSAFVYVREGVASLPSSGKKVPALQTATFAADGDIIVIRNDGQRKGDKLDLARTREREKPRLDTYRFTELF